MNFGKIFEKFEKMVKKGTPFFKNFPKEIHSIVNFITVAYRGPHRNHLFFPSVAYRPPLYRLVASKNENKIFEIFNNILEHF